MSEYRPKQYQPSQPFTVPLIVKKPTYTKYNGVRAATYPDDGFRIYATFRTFGGTETNVDGVYSIIDTANVETWYRPDITSDCLVIIEATGAEYHIIGDPENISMRNQYMTFKVQRVKGGA